MRRILIVALATLALLATLAFFLAAEATQPGRTQPIPGRYATEKEISLRLEGRSRTSFGHDFRVRLINPTSSALTFSGYDESSPLYRIQKWVDDAWEEHQVGWFCGTGLGQRAIPRARSSVIAVHATDDLLPIRVGVEFEHRGENRTVWSARIERQSPP